MTIREHMMDVIETVPNWPRGKPHTELTAFCTIVGDMALDKHGQAEIMVVGRAVNGWGPTPWKKTDFADATRRRAILEEAMADPADTDTIRSAFLRVAKYVVAGLGIGSSEGSLSRLVWTNLYKVSYHKGGDPPVGLRNVLREKSVALFRRELIEYRPKRLLLVTDILWAEPFLPPEGDPSMNIVKHCPKELVQRVGFLTLSDHEHPVSFVVVQRPERKPGVQEKPFAEQIVEQFRSLT